MTKLKWPPECEQGRHQLGRWNSPWDKIVPSLPKITSFKSWPHRAWCQTPSRVPQSQSVMFMTSWNIDSDFQSCPETSQKCCRTPLSGHQDAVSKGFRATWAGFRHLWKSLPNISKCNEEQVFSSLKLVLPIQQLHLGMRDCPTTLVCQFPLPWV